jgi:hypothetical protein
MAISAQEVVDRIQQQNGPAWKNPSVDIFHSGDKGNAVTGIEWRHLRADGLRADCT